MVACIRGRRALAPRGQFHRQVRLTRVHALPTEAQSRAAVQKTRVMIVRDDDTYFFAMLYQDDLYRLFRQLADFNPRVQADPLRAFWTMVA